LTSLPSPGHRPTSAAALSLDAQAALLPQALGLFAVSLPIFVWAGSFAHNAVFMALTFAVFAINWGAFYVVVNWTRREAAADVALRLRIHIASGLLWALAVGQIAAFGAGAGAAREPILMTAVAAGVICIFFTAPCLPSLLIVGPAAMAGPLLALMSRPESRGEGALAWGAFALAFALCLILNQNLRRQFAMTAEREALVEAREESLQSAERLARSKSDLVATLSDEIRNGLAGVINVLAAAGQGPRAAPSREQMASALAAARELVTVLNATLDSENAEAGRLRVDAAPFDPVGLVRDIVPATRAQAMAKGLEFSLFVEPELEAAGGSARADGARVRQVLANLLGNAVKYTVRGRIEVRIERRGDDRVAIAIADTGPGLSTEELERAFQPFRRIERTSAGVPGAGLGLSLSRQLSELMQARLAAQSAIGVGSCFTLELPYEARTAAATHNPDEAATASFSTRGGLRVLVADPDSLGAAMLRATLEQLGHQVVHAQSAHRALDLAKACDFDVAFVGARLTQEAGVNPVETIRAAGGPAGATPIVAVIGGDPQEARDCLDAGADCIMRMPASIGGVARALAEAAASSRNVAPAAPAPLALVASARR